MSEDTNDAQPPEGEPETAKSSRMPLIISLVLFLVAAGGGFYATSSGQLSLASILGGESKKSTEQQTKAASAPVLAFLPVGEIVVPLGPGAQAKYLLFTSEIEVSSEDTEQLLAMLPRIRDLFNTYLRAVEARDLEQPDATMRLRDQLLRRLRTITDPLSPRDILFTSFILR